MSLSIHQAAVPVFTRALANLSAILARGEAFAAERKIDEAALLGYRMAPDMFPLTRQVQIATDISRGSMARLSGGQAMNGPDVETSFAQLRDRVDRAIAEIEAFTPQSLEGAEARVIVLPLRAGETRFTGTAYLQTFAIPNVYFHVTAAYLILRHNGVELGKMDFLGKLAG